MGSIIARNSVTRNKLSRSTAHDHRILCPTALVARRIWSRSLTSPGIAAKTRYPIATSLAVSNLLAVISARRNVTWEIACLASKPSRSTAAVEGPHPTPYVTKAMWSNLSVCGYVERPSIVAVMPVTSAAAQASEKPLSDSLPSENSVHSIRPQDRLMTVSRLSTYALVSAEGS